jgi:hypothetical protein
MSIKQIIIWALLLRLLIAPFFYHTDIKDIAFRVSFLESNHVINIYDFLPHHFIAGPQAPDFSYPPLTYFTLGSYQWLVHPLLGKEFNSWIYDFSGLTSISPFIFRYLLLLKLPYLIFDLLIGLLLYKFFKEEDDKKEALLFWFFNPLNLYGIYVVGQFDIIPSLLAFLGVFLFRQNKVFFSALCLGLGAAFKSFPLLLLPFFLTCLKDFKKSSYFAYICLSTYLLFTLPFILSPSFQKYVLFSNQSQRIFQFKIPLFFADISLFLILGGLLGLLALKKKSEPLIFFLTSVLLLIFAVSHFHPHWIVWLTPFLSIYKVKYKIPNLLFLGYYISFFIIFFLFGDRYLVQLIYSPLSQQFLEIPTYTDLLPKPLLANLITINRVIFFALSSLIIYLGYTSSFKQKTKL